MSRGKVRESSILQLGSKFLSFFDYIFKVFSIFSLKYQTNYKNKAVNMLKQFSFLK